MSDEYIIVEEVDGDIEIIEVGTQGPAGIQGIPGATSGDKTYKHEQMIASDTWVIAHALAKFPSVVVLDSSGALCEGHIEYDTVNQITLTFSAAFGGVAHLN